MLVAPPQHLHYEWAEVFISALESRSVVAMASEGEHDAHVIPLCGW